MALTQAEKLAKAQALATAQIVPATSVSIDQDTDVNDMASASVSGTEVHIVNPKEVVLLDMKVYGELNAQLLPNKLAGVSYALIGTPLGRITSRDQDFILACKSRTLSQCSLVQTLGGYELNSWSSLAIDLKRGLLEQAIESAKALTFKSVADFSVFLQ